MRAPVAERPPRVRNRNRAVRRNRITTDAAPAQRTGAIAVGATAVGALAVGALAIRALAIGRLAIRRAAIRDVRIRNLEIEELTVRKLHGPDEVNAQAPRRTVSPHS